MHVVAISGLQASTPTVARSFNGQGYSDTTWVTGVMCGRYVALWEKTKPSIISPMCAVARAVVLHTRPCDGLARVSLKVVLGWCRRCGERDMWIIPMKLSYRSLLTMEIWLGRLASPKNARPWVTKQKRFCERCRCFHAARSYKMTIACPAIKNAVWSIVPSRNDPPKSGGVFPAWAWQRSTCLH